MSDCQQLVKICFTGKAMGATHEEYALGNRAQIKQYIKNEGYSYACTAEWYPVIGIHELNTVKFMDVRILENALS